MKKSELKQIIKEEIKKTLKENDMGDYDMGDYDMDDDDDDDDIDIEFQNAPEYHTYNEVLEIFKFYEDEDIINKFKSKFKDNQKISKEEYGKFASKYVDDISEYFYIKVDWISLSDPSIYERYEDFFY